MINNRQQGGRRRGRGGGPRSPNMPSGGNRQDNRQRGNAAQLLEKYKSLARDSQLAGDRVQTETYLQYADHYHRVLNENRSRYEEQNPRRQQGDFGDEDEDQDEGVEAFGNGQSEPREERQQREDRPYREDRQAREDRPQREFRQPREDRPQREPREYEAREPREPRGNQGGSEFGNGTEQEERRPRAPRRERAEVNGEPAEERIALDVLPPAIGIEGEAPRPRRTRRPRPAEGDEIAPAA